MVGGRDVSTLIAPGVEEEADGRDELGSQERVSLNTFDVLESRKGQVVSKTWRMHARRHGENLQPADFLLRWAVGLQNI